MNLELTIYFEKGEDGFWIASIPEIPGAFSQGASQDEARTNVIGVMKDLMVSRRELAIKNMSENGSFESLSRYA